MFIPRASGLRVLGALLVLLIGELGCERIRPFKSQVKVVNGEDPFIHRDPVIKSSYWIPYLIVGGQVGKTCTGIAVGPRKVLTSAHCLWSKTSHSYAKPQDIGLVFKLGASQRRYGVATFVPHPYYVPGLINVYASSFDLAVLTLVETLDQKVFTVKPEVVTDTLALKKLLQQRKFLFMGYGGHDRLTMGVDIPIPNALCLKDPASRAKALRISCKNEEVLMFCAGPDAQDARITYGDSGGPAFVVENGVPKVIGMSTAVTNDFSFYETFDRTETRNWLLKQL